MQPTCLSYEQINHELVDNHHHEYRYFSCVLPRQQLLLAEVKQLGLLVPAHLDVPCCKASLFFAHQFLADILDRPNLPLDLGEDPIYHIYRYQHQHVFTTRLVRPGDSRRQELTSEGSSVESRVDCWLRDIAGKGLSGCHFLMQAGVASCGCSGKYSLMMMLNFVSSVQEAIKEDKPLVIASTVRSQNVQQAPSSSKLIQSFAAKYLDYGQSSVLAQMAREIPTQLWCFYVEREELIDLRTKLIAAFNKVVGNMSI